MKTRIPNTACLHAGYWLFARFRRQCASKGIYRAASNLARHGFPLDLALKFLRAL